MTNENHQKLCIWTLVLVVGAILFHVCTHWPYLEVKQMILMRGTYERLTPYFSEDDNYEEYFCDKANKVTVQIPEFKATFTDDDIKAHLSKQVPCYTKETKRHWENLLK